MRYFLFFLPLIVMSACTQTPEIPSAQIPTRQVSETVENFASTATGVIEASGAVPVWVPDTPTTIQTSGRQ